VTRRRYRLLPHTADLLVEVCGSDLASLIETAAEAIFSLLTDRRRVRPTGRRVVVIPPGPPEEQLLLALRRSLALFDADRFLARSASATMESGSVTLTLAGEPADPSRHAAFREIKAVTRHALAVRRDAGGWTARFLLDV